MVSKIITVLFTILVISARIATGIDINGYTLGSASFHGGQAHFVKDLEWVLTNSSHLTLHLRLVGRDQWSVSLCAASSSLQIQVDYWTRWIKYNNFNRSQITAAAVGIINGRNIATVYYNGGSFKQTAFNAWVWTNSGLNSPVTLVETSRDEWSVYLRTNDSKLNVQIDYHRISDSVLVVEPRTTAFRSLLRLTVRSPIAIDVSSNGSTSRFVRNTKRHNKPFM